MTHKFNIGQIVELEPSLLRSIFAGAYEIRKLTPASDRNPADPCYRVKRIDERYERVVLESEIVLSKALDVPTP